MDRRDKYLNQHMQQRILLAAGLPAEKQRHWAMKCVALAAHQHRTAFYLMANLWLESLSAQGATH